MSMYVCVLCTILLFIALCNGTAARSSTNPRRFHSFALSTVHNRRYFRACATVVEKKNIEKVVR